MPSNTSGMRWILFASLVKGDAGEEGGRGTAREQNIVGSLKRANVLED